MNIYFLHPSDFNWDKFGILFDILKVKKIIDLADFFSSEYNEEDYEEELKLLCKEKHIIYIHYDENKNDIKQAVHAFIKPMSTKVISENGKSGYIYKDLYKNSRARNPIYNLEFCDDENLLIFVSIHNPEEFSSYALNILKKYAKEFHYEDKLCFLRIQLSGKACFLTSLFNGDTFKPLLRRVSESSDRSYGISKISDKYFYHESDFLSNHTKNLKINNHYDPVISYINYKIQSLQDDNLKDVSSLIPPL